MRMDMRMDMEAGQLSYGPYVFLSFSDVIVGSHEAGDVIVKTFRDRIENATSASRCLASRLMRVRGKLGR